MTTTDPAVEIQEDIERARTAAVVAKNIRLAHWAVRQYLRIWPAHPDYDDRVQDASIALWRAAKRYDQSRRAEFITFAAPAMRREVLYRQRLSDRHGFTRVGDEASRRPVATRPASLDKPAEEDGDPLRDIVPIRAAGGTEADSLAAVWEAVEKLPTQLQRDVVALSFRDGMTDRAIAKRLGNSRATVYDIRKRAIGHLRKILDRTE